MDDKVASFMHVTHASAEEAREYLERSGGNLSEAVVEYVSGKGGEGPGLVAGGGRLGSGTSAAPAAPPVVPPPRSAAPEGRRPSGLGGVAPRPSRPRSGIQSLADLDRAQSNEEGQDYYTGGYNSGINVHDPNARGSGGDGDGSRGGNGAPGMGGGGRNDLIGSIIDKARKQRAAPDSAESAAPEPVKFGGAGFRLGDGTGPPPTAVPQEPTPAPPRNLNYCLTFYRNGFTVENGPLRRYDDPANRAFLEDIERGFVPDELQTNGPVLEASIKLEDRKGEDYVESAAPKKKAVPFSGAGMSLGSGASSSTAPPPPPTSALAASSVVDDGTTVDPDQPRVSVQVRLVDGTKIVARLNETHTIADLRRYIDARHALGGRAYELSTTFPRTVLSESAMTLKEAKLDGAVVVVTAR